ncbi:MAG: ParB/RepB/Spo0J family partition protein [Lachnospiraceae bacterium]
MATRKTGLGRGLNALIPEKQDSKKREDIKPVEIIKEVVKEVEVIKEVEKTLNILDIEPNRDQPRKQFDEDALEELAESIRQYGIIQPLVVTKKEGYYEIIAGERRWRAARMAGLTEVPVVIKEFGNQEILEVSLIENLQREDLNPIDEAFAYQRLIQEFHLKQDEVAAKVSKSRVAITNSLRLLKLDKRVQEMLVEEMITSGHARCLLALEDGDKQYEVATKILDERLSVRDAEALIKSMMKEKKEKIEKKEDYSFLYREMEERVKNILGSKVSIKNKKNNKGKIEIEYYSQEELERLIEMLQSIRV